MTISPLAICQVISHRAPWGLQVAFKSSSQGPAFPVQMGWDYADALRVKQTPLPGVGTWGLVAFPYGDIRNAIWLKSILPSQMDALTTSTSGSASEYDPFIDYEAHFSGHWSLRDGQGNYAEQWPDGSYLTAASGTTLPTVYRHTVEKNVQKNIAFTRTARIPSPPAAYQFRFHHESGTDIQLNASGSITVSGASGATLSMLFGTATLTIDTSGKATLALPGVETFNITQGGASANDFLVLVSKFLTAFNAHKHTGVTTGGGQTGTPVTPLASGDVDSTIFKISN